MIRSRLVWSLLVALPVSVYALQEPPTPQPRAPRFRGGANLVRVDTYVSQNGAPILDLTASDFEVLEDDVPQRVEEVELIRVAPPAPEQSRVEPNTVAQSRALAEDPDSRLFVLFLDVWHVQLAGSRQAAAPIISLLDRVIGRDDLVGIMTPEMSAQNLTMARKTATIEDILKNNWFWGERDQVNTSDPREQEIGSCYPDGGDTAGLAAEMIERRRERKTIEAIDDLVGVLEGTRDERTFVVLLSEGWRLFPRNEALARAVRPFPGAERNVPGGPKPVGVENGTLKLDPNVNSSFQSCERERSLLAFTDNEVEFRRILQKANRANVSFYPVDARGLVVFDETIGPRKPARVTVDAERLRARQTALRELAEQTDGTVVLNTNDVTGAVNRLLTDTNAYYLLRYYSTNTRLDGRFRRIAVRLKRPGLDVRSRRGYLAPTEAEMASARVDALMNGAPAGHTTTPAAMARALERTAGRTTPLRAEAVGGPGYIWFTVELDPTTMKQTAWQAGGKGRLVVEHARGDLAPIAADVTFEPGQRTLSLVRPERDLLAPGRYVVRFQLSPQAGGASLQATVDTVVPESTALLAQAAVASRRGPTTGLQYQRTADPRFRRTERLRLEIPRFSERATLSARLLNRAGTPMGVAVSVADRMDDSLQLRFIVADVTLAPLAQGDYIVQVTAEHEGKKEEVNYGFRIVP